MNCQRTKSSSVVSIKSYHWSILISDWTTDQGCRELSEGLNRPNPSYSGRRVVFQKCLEIVCLVDPKQQKETISFCKPNLKPGSLVTDPKELT